MSDQISSFFNEISTNKVQDLDMGRMAFIATNEWHWSYEDFMECSIPYFFLLLEERSEDIKRQEAEQKKNRR